MLTPHSLCLSLEPSAVLNLVATALESTSIRVSWSSPQCPNGIINQYQVYYRESDTIQTVPISSIGYDFFIVESLEYNITDLIPFRNYSIHVQAVVNSNLLGWIEKEVLTQTLSDVDVDIPAVHPTTSPIDSPSQSQVTYLIGDPAQIDTGRVV